MKQPENKSMHVFALAVHWMRRTPFCLLIIFFLVMSCCHSSTKSKKGQALNIEFKNDSLQVDMSLLSGRLGKLTFNNKFIGIFPKKIVGGSDTLEIEYYVVDTPAFKFADFTIEYIQQLRIHPKKISSLAYLAQELNSLVSGYYQVSVSAKLDVDIKDGKMTVTNAATKTTVVCTCPCDVTMGKESASCK